MTDHEIFFNEARWDDAKVEICKRFNLDPNLLTSLVVHMDTSEVVRMEFTGIKLMTAKDFFEIMLGEKREDEVR